MRPFFRIPALLEHCVVDGSSEGQREVGDSGRDRRDAGSQRTCYDRILARAACSSIVIEAVEVGIPAVMVQPPEKIRALRDQGVLEIQWSQDKCLRYPFKLLRCECPCASCVNEFTGERILNPDTIPESIVPAALNFSGNYALKVDWSDGHNTGIYTWEQLNILASAPGVHSVEQSR
ncbi:DUF971 domain-containing protein [Planctomicrobium sp. SH661]|uniref:DUF971 domain-containing protein n=1 Tax=Planctomicrobium sp. SH661 TaxID=3448124 RepID=UPI003F5C7775